MKKFAFLLLLLLVACATKPTTIKDAFDSGAMTCKIGNSTLYVLNDKYKMDFDNPDLNVLYDLDKIYVWGAQGAFKIDKNALTSDNPYGISSPDFVKEQYGNNQADCTKSSLTDADFVPPDLHFQDISSLGGKK